jgi:hypothetical protein
VRVRARAKVGAGVRVGASARAWSIASIAAFTSIDCTTTGSILSP